MGGAQFVQFGALAALTNTCRLLGSLLLMHQTANRLRLLSIDTTEKSVSGEPVGVSAIFISLVRFWPVPVASRKWSVPPESGVPMFKYKTFDVQPAPVVQPAAWKTFPVTWSMAGYPSAPNGEYTAPVPGGSSSPVAFV